MPQLSLNELVSEWIDEIIAMNEKLKKSRKRFHGFMTKWSNWEMNKLFCL